MAFHIFTAHRSQNPHEARSLWNMQTRIAKSRTWTGVYPVSSGRRRETDVGSLLFIYFFMRSKFPGGGGKMDVCCVSFPLRREALHSLETLKGLCRSSFASSVFLLSVAPSFTLLTSFYVSRSPSVLARPEAFPSHSFSFFHVLMQFLFVHRAVTSYHISEFSFFFFSLLYICSSTLSFSPFVFFFHLLQPWSRSRQSCPSLFIAGIFASLLTISTERWPGKVKCLVYLCVQF